MSVDHESETFGFGTHTCSSCVLFFMDTCQLELRDTFPSANVSLMVTKCPSLLTEHYKKVVDSVDELKRWLPDGACLDSLVDSIPCILLLNVNEIMTDLARYGDIQSTIISPA